LCRLATSLNRLNEIACNSGLTERQERRKQNLQTRIKAVLEGAGLVLNHFNNDPRGYAVYLDLPDGCYNSFGGRECGYGIRRSTKVAPGFRYAGQCVLLMVTTRSYMVSPPDAVAAFPSAEAVVAAIGQIEVHGIASRVIVEVVEDQARAFQHGLDPGL